MEVYNRMDLDSLSDKDPEVKNKLKNDSWGGNRAKLFLVVTGSFIFATVIVLIIIVYRVEKPSNQQKNIDNRACPDLTIIGGGLTGTYIAWMLRNSSKIIHLYEMSNKFGGRLLENNLKYYINKPKCISNRIFSPKSDLNFLKLLKKFSMNYTLKNRNKTFYYLRNHLKTEEQRNNSKLLYFVDKNEKYLNFDEIRRLFIERITGHKINKAHLKSVCSLDEKDKNTLLSSELMNGLNGYASTDGINYLNDLWGYNGPDSDSSLGYLAEDLLDELSTCSEISNIEILPSKLLNNTKNTFTFHSHKLESIEKKENIYRLRFSVTENLNGKLKRHNLIHSSCAKNVILAIPKSSLAELNWIGSFNNLNYKRIMNSLITSKLVQIILLYNESWWPEKLTTLKTDLPAQKITYIPLNYDKNSSRVNKSSFDEYANQTSNLPQRHSFILMIDTNEKYFNFWVELESRNQVIHRLKKFFARILSKSENSIPNPEKYSIHVKGDKFPDYSCKYLWKKNVDWCYTRDKMSKPLDHQNVFIVNDSFDSVENQGKYETLIKNSNNILRKYFSNFIQK